MGFGPELPGNESASGGKSLGYSDEIYSPILRSFAATDRYQM